MEKLRQTAQEATCEAGKILMSNLSREKRIDYKGAINLVTDTDRQSEDKIISIIKSRFPAHCILAEEREIEQCHSSYKWIIDPLDGTTNYAHGFPFFCISIALEIDGQVMLGMVYDPVREELFTAEKGHGAFLNGEAIHVSPTGQLDKSLLATGFPYDLRESAENNLNHWNNFITRVQALRRAGAAALDLSYVAAGRLDGFWELKLFPWDVAAGYLLVEEAGGKISSFAGGDFHIYLREIIASNGLIHNEMIEILSLSNSLLKP